jgi:hypothetical protein
MKSRQRRLKAIEVNLTPDQVVLLWMSGALKGTYESGAFQSPPPRSAIANSIARIVTNALKGHAMTVIEKAILQARQEADLLYNIIIGVNVSVQNQYLERYREFAFLLGFFSAVMRGCIAKHSEKSLRALTLFFVEKILVVEAAISEISAQRFRGQPILFSDSAAKLNEQFDFAEKALELFNSLAREESFLELNRDEISSMLRTEVDQQVSRSVLVARGEMLAVFGNDAELRANFDKLVATTLDCATSSKTLPPERTGSQELIS